MLYYFTIGPFISPFLILIENRTYVKNIGFYPSLHPVFIYQVVSWLFLAGGFFLFFVFNQNNYLDVINLWGAASCVFMQCVVIAFRYATTTKSKLDAMHKRILTWNESSSESLSSGWKDKSPDMID